MSDAWDPAQYERFAAERSQPFHDLAGLVHGTGHARVADLGCGTGALTADLHRRLQAAETVGVDSSAAMLASAAPHAGGGLRFEEGDIGTWSSAGDHDVVFSNAALQWVPDHPAVLRRWTVALRPGGQLAVQVPANVDHPSHTVSAQLAAEPPFVDDFDGAPPADPVRGVLPPEQYAELLHQLGFEAQHVRLQVYGHVLPSTAAVVEWVKGTSLTRFQKVLPEERFDAFVAAYRRRLLAALGDHTPYFYAFKRILLWGRLP